MDYLREINLFERWLESNYLANDAQLMWYRLMALANKACWPEWVQVDNLRLMTLIQARSQSTMLKHRDKLVEIGRIVYQKGGKGNPNKYKLIPFYTTYSAKNDTPNDTPNDTHIKTKTNINTKTNNTPLPPKGKSRVSKNKMSFDDTIAGYTENPALRDALTWYIEMRKAKDAVPTLRAVELIFKALDKLANDDETRIAILEQSTMNSWKGVFPLKEQHKPGATPQGGKVLSHTQYNQRDYTAADDPIARAAKRMLEGSVAGGSP